VILSSGGLLRTQRRNAETVLVIEEAALQRINYFDSIRAYTGSDKYYGEFWEKRPDIRQKIFQACKSSAKD
jgi:aryl-alcohol dehydrogenase-like predicted oxidoreductase